MHELSKLEAIWFAWHHDIGEKRIEILPVLQDHQGAHPAHDFQDLETGFAKDVRGL